MIKIGHFLSSSTEIPRASLRLQFFMTIRKRDTKLPWSAAQWRIVKLFNISVSDRLHRTYRSRPARDWLYCPLLIVALFLFKINARNRDATRGVKLMIPQRSLTLIPRNWLLSFFHQIVKSAKCHYVRVLVSYTYMRKRILIYYRKYLI